ncbi:cytochrome P450 72A225-like [Coffea arabica]|uniref:Cytochrome P450 72A225-like n=1 Tax=Coffea arabica TaxID=13443 RepID=A0A6P6SCV1_COFAR|nr:cytochrome P450 CYP72A219-like [Coffea arabica]
MDMFYSIIGVLCSVFLTIWAWIILNWVWFKPKKLEKYLRQQGLGGSHYRLLFGDMKETAQMVKQAYSKPINFTNDIVPRILPFVDKLIRSSGTNCLTWMGPSPALLLIDPELVKEVLTKNYVYQKPRNNPLGKLLAEGFATYDTDKWAKNRRIISPAFHLEKLKHMVPAFCLSCSEMLSKWENSALADGSLELDVWPDIRTLAGDMISRTAFGSNYEEGRKIFELQMQQSELFEQAIQSIYVPGWRFLPTKRNKKMKKIFKDVRSLILGIINKRVRAMQEGEATHSDLLGLLLESNFKEIQEHGNERFGMTSEEVIQECKLFYFAGHETTAILLVWTLILLSKHSDWQARARDEVLQVFGNNIPDFEELNRLKIVTMILNEVLRLYTPGVMISRRVNEDTKLGELSLPSGMFVLMPSILLHHDPSLWGDDAKEFNPERFSEGVAKATKGQPCFLPFGGGPRICIGQNFALLEAKMALALILQRFSFELSPLYTHAPYLFLTLLQPQYGAQLIMKKL